MFLILLASSAMLAVMALTDCSQYTNTVQLMSSPSTTLSYVSNSTSISMKLSTTQSAWVAIGRTNRAGRMSSAEAAVGTPGAGVSYYIIQSTSNYYKSSSVQLTGTSITQTTSGTVMTFTQKLKDGVVPITDSSGNGSLNFIYALGYTNDNSMSSIHQYTGSLTITLSPCVPSSPSGGSSGGRPTSGPSKGGASSGGSSGGSPTSGPSGGGASSGSTQPNTTTAFCTQYSNAFQVASGSTIQYVSTNSTISFLFSSDQKAWLSIGRSSRGRMSGSDAVIGQPSSNNVAFYVLNGYSVNPDSSVTLSGTSITQSSSGTVLKFTQNLMDGRFPINNPSGSQTFIWAIGCDNILSQHCSRGSFTLQLSPCTGNNTGSNNYTVATALTLTKSEYQRYVNWHGYLAAVAWGLLVPMAVCASVFRNSLTRFNQDRNGNPRKVQAWFIIHRGLNVLALIVTLAFFGIIVRTVQRKGGSHFLVIPSDGAARAHSLFGIVFFVLVIVQVLIGIFRPHIHPPKPVDPYRSESSGDDPIEESAAPIKSKIRIIWEYLHRGLGLFLLGGSIYQVLSGLFLYSSRLGTNWFSGVFWVYLVSIVLVLAFIIMARSHA